MNLNKEITLLDTHALTMEAYDEASDFSKYLMEDLGREVSPEERLDLMFEGMNVGRYLNRLIEQVVEHAEASTFKTGVAWVVLAGNRTGWGGGKGALYFRPWEEIQLHGDDIKITIEEDGTLNVATSDHDGTTYMTLYLFSKREEYVSTYRSGYANRIDDEQTYYDGDTAKHLMRDELELKKPYRLSKKLKLSLLEISEYE